MGKHGIPAVDAARQTSHPAVHSTIARVSAVNNRASIGFWYKYLEFSFVLIVIGSLLCIDLFPGGPFDAARNWMFDAFQRAWPAERQKPQTVVVEIDDELIRRVGQWPWPRNKLALLISAMRDARAVGLDILLPEADRLAPDKLLTELPIEAGDLRQALLALPDPDIVLASALRGVPTVLAMTVDDNATATQPSPVVTIPVREQGDGARGALPRASGVRPPLPVLARAARGLGVVSALRSRSGEIAGLPSVVETDGSILPGFAVELLAVASDAGAILLNTGPTGVVSVSIGALSAPTDPSGCIRPRFVDASRLFRIPAYRIMDGPSDPLLLRDKIVIIGVSAGGIAETFQTPLGTQQSSLQIQAQLVESVIAGDTLYRPFWAGGVEAAAALGLGLAATLLIGRIPYRIHAVLLGALVLLLVGGSVALFRGQGLLLDSVVPVTCLVSASIVSLAARFRIEIETRRRRETELKVALVQREAERREFKLQSEADALRHSLDFAVNAARLGVWDADLRNGTWVHSPQHDRILGLANPPASWSPAILLDRVVPEDLALVRSDLATAEATGTLELECAIAWPGGQPHHIHVLGRFWRDADGTVTRTAGVVADITRQRSLETRLRQSEKMYAVGLLAGGVAHNFNNLLTVVLGSLELARRKVEASSGASELIGSAMVASRKCAEIARHLLAFGRVQPLRPTMTDPAELLRTVYAMLGDAMPEKVRVQLNTQAGLPKINIDPTEFELALLNLAMNAKDAMPDGGQIDVNAFTQWIRNGSQGRNGRYLVVEVADNGAGIPPDQLSKVFEPFFTTKEIGQGTGLGLSQVHGFAHQSGGAVEIDSIVGQGTRVRLYLPTDVPETDP